MKTCQHCNSKNLNSAIECEDCGSSLQHVQSGIAKIKIENANGAHVGESDASEKKLNDDNVNGAVELESEKEVPKRPWGMLLILIYAVFMFYHFFKGAKGIAPGGGESQSHLESVYIVILFGGALSIIIWTIYTIWGFIKPTMVPKNSFYDTKLAKNLYSEAYALWEQKKEKELIKVFAQLIVERPDSQEVEWAHLHFKVNKSELYDMVRKYRSDKQLDHRIENTANHPAEDSNEPVIQQNIEDIADMANCQTNTDSGIISTEEDKQTITEIELSENQTSENMDNSRFTNQISTSSTKKPQKGDLVCNACGYIVGVGRPPKYSFMGTLICPYCQEKVFHKALKTSS